MADPSVNGTVISWPDDVWYQVQSPDGTTTLCNGGSTCNVTPGEYLVINHKLGIRYNDVQVGVSEDNNDIQVNGQVISWLDDGWYQVQTADGSTLLCNGGSYCDVESGTYLVIYHTTGVRFTGIEVPEGATGNSASAVINRDNHAKLLTLVFSVYTGRIYDNTLPGMPLAFMETHPSVPVDIPDDEQNEYRNEYLVRYTCDNGGVLDYLLSGGSYLETINDFKWDNCLDVKITQNGWLSSSNYEYGGYYRDLMSSSYSADYANGQRVEISGKYGDIKDSHINPYIRRINRWISHRDGLLIAE